MKCQKPVTSHQYVYMHNLVRLQPYFDYAAQSDNCNFLSIHVSEKIELLAEACHTWFDRWRCTHFN